MPYHVLSRACHGIMYCLVMPCHVMSSFLMCSACHIDLLSLYNSSFLLVFCFVALGRDLSSSAIFCRDDTTVLCLATGPLCSVTFSFLLKLLASRFMYRVLSPLLVLRHVLPSDLVRCVLPPFLSLNVMSCLVISSHVMWCHVMTCPVRSSYVLCRIFCCLSVSRALAPRRKARFVFAVASSCIQARGFRFVFNFSVPVFFFVCVFFWHAGDLTLIARLEITLDTKSLGPSVLSPPHAGNSCLLRMMPLAISSASQLPVHGVNGGLADSRKVCGCFFAPGPAAQVGKREQCGEQTSSVEEGERGRISSQLLHTAAANINVSARRSDDFRCEVRARLQRAWGKVLPENKAFGRSLLWMAVYFQFPRLPMVVACCLLCLD